jgi:hypothetical protein
MNAAVAVAHCPPLPADPPLSQVRSTSGILNARSAPFLTKRAGMAHAITLRSDTPSEHDQGCARSHSVDENDRSTSIAARGAAARAGRQVGQSDRPAARAATVARSSVSTSTFRPPTARSATRLASGAPCYSDLRYSTRSRRSPSISGRCSRRSYRATTAARSLALPSWKQGRCWKRARSGVARRHREGFRGASPAARRIPPCEACRQWAVRARVQPTQGRGPARRSRTPCLGARTGQERWDDSSGRALGQNALASDGGNALRTSSCVEHDGHCPRGKVQRQRQAAKRMTFGRS